MSASNSQSTTLQIAQARERGCAIVALADVDPEAVKAGRVILPTAFGPEPVAYLRTQWDGPWVVCGKGWAQRSYCCHGGTLLIVEGGDR